MLIRNLLALVAAGGLLVGAGLIGEKVIEEEIRPSMEPADRSILDEDEDGTTSSTTTPSDTTVPETTAPETTALETTVPETTEP